MKLRTVVCIIVILFAVTLNFAQEAREGITYGGASLVRKPADVTNQYFVMFKAPPGINEKNMLINRGATIIYEYTIIPAFAIQVPNQNVLNLIRLDPRVKFTDAVQTYYALGTEQDPEMGDTQSDQAPPGDATQDIIAAWVNQVDNNHLQFTLKIADLTNVNPATGDGLPVNGVWKVAFTLHKSGNALSDEYFVQMRKPESGPPEFGWGFVDENGINSEQGTVDQGTILIEEGLIRFVMTNSVFSGAPNQNSNPQAGDLLIAPYAEANQLVGASGTGVLSTLDRAPDEGPGRDYSVAHIVPPYTISPAELEFEEIELGGSATGTLTLTNTGENVLTISSVTSSKPEFTVSPAQATINPSGQAVFTVTFTPTTEGRKSAFIIFTPEGSVPAMGVPVRGDVPTEKHAETTPWGVDTVKAPSVWGATQGQSIKLAVLDTGIDSLHYELDGRYKGGYNFVTKTPHPWDGHSHGTHVSGTIAAEMNSVGVVGVAPQVDLYSLKVLSDAGSGTSADILAAIDWCVQNNMNIASMSLGGGLGITLPNGQPVRVPVYSPTEEAAYQSAYDSGLLIICASGNDGEPLVMYPAAYSPNMAVGAIDKNLALASFSNYGIDQEIVAPGVDVLSTVPMGTGRDSRIDLAGTSLEAIELQFAGLTSSAGITKRAYHCGKGLFPGDFPATVAGNIALIQRGDSSFASKIRKAQDAGAVAAIIYNNVEGNFNGTLGTARDDENNRDWIPGISLSMQDGEALVSLGSPIITLVNRVDDFNKYSGTSMATPHVSAVAALTWAVNPSLSNEQVRDILKSTAKDLGVPGNDPQFGAGLVNASAAVEAARASIPVDTTVKITPGNAVITWTGGPYTAVTADPAACTALTCDEFMFGVNVPSSYYTTNPSHTVRVHVSWDNANTDFDVYVFDAEGNQVNSSTQGNTTFEDVNLNQLTSGTYRVQVVAFATVNASYSGSITLAAPAPDQARSGVYQPGQYTFTQPKALLGPEGVVFGSQDLEPRAAYDALGNIYVAAINGTPAGTDLWKSMDGGNTFTYLGQPDGAQAASAMVGRTPGAGGGDEDIAIGSSGRVYVTGLWGAQVPLSITMCNSTNGGSTWVANPVSQIVPLVDRQWIAAYGENTVYLTFQQLGVLLSGTNSIFCMKSTDGGVTFTQMTEVTTPQFGVQPDFQGNIAVDQRNGYIYTVFIGHPGNSIYIARSTDGGNTFILKLVHSGPLGASYGNVFPILSIDRAGGVHVVYSDGSNIYLCSSSNQGLTWTTPLRVSNGVESKTSLSPWVDAGDAGRVNIIWWGTSSSSALAEDAEWKVFMAQTLNAFASTPTVTQKAVTDVFHTGPICVEGTGCEEGTRSLAEYASTTVYHNGKAMIVYPDDKQTENPLTYFIMQNGGSNVVLQQSNQTEISDQASSKKELPKQFSLEQNYPNPFNPVTTIQYHLPFESRVSLKVYNMLGQEVATLVNGAQEGGSYSVTFDASELSSGVYIYKLVAGSFVDIKRMVITK